MLLSCWNFSEKPDWSNKKPAGSRLFIEAAARQQLIDCAFLINGRHGPQGLHHFGHDLQEAVDVGFGVVPAEGDEQGALGQAKVHAGADEHVGGPERPGGAGGAGGHADAFFIHEQH